MGTNVHTDRGDDVRILGERKERSLSLPCIRIESLMHKRPLKVSSFLYPSCWYYVCTLVCTYSAVQHFYPQFHTMCYVLCVDISWRLFWVPLSLSLWPFFFSSVLTQFLPVFLEDLVTLPFLTTLQRFRLCKPGFVEKRAHKFPLLPFLILFLLIALGRRVLQFFVLVPVECFVPAKHYFWLDFWGLRKKSGNHPKKE